MSRVATDHVIGMSSHMRLLFVGLCGLVIVAVVFAEPVLHIALPHRSAIVALAGFLLFASVITSRSFFLRYVHEATPESLAAIRILACAILLGSVLREDLASTALLPAELRQSMGAMRILYALPFGLQKLAANATGLEILKLLTALILFLGMIGLGTRIVVPLGAVSYLVFGGILRQYTYYYHQHLTPLYLLIVLSATPCGDGWSIDRLWRGFRGRAAPAAGRPAPIYGWSQYACWVVIALPYVEAGLSKLRNGGLFWWNADNLRAILYRDALYLPWPARFNGQGFSLHLTGAPDLVFALLGISALLVELSYGLILFSRTARRILPIAAFLMHTGMFLLQKVLFLDLVLVQFLFLDFNKLRNAIMRRIGAMGTLQECGIASTGERGAMQKLAAPRLLWPLSISGLVTVLLVAWFYHVEFYPLSAWQMYSGIMEGVVYTKVYVRRESGAVSRAYFEDAVGALPANRSQTYLAMCFDPTGVSLCEKFLGAVAAAYNRRVPPAGRVTQLEIQEWSWDFRAYPAEPGRATLVRHFLFDPSHASAERSLRQARPLER